MPALQLSELPEDVRIGAAASFAYLNRSYGLLAAHVGGDLIDARRVLEALEESVSVTTVSLAAHQELAIQQFIQRGEEGAFAFLRDVQNRSAVLQGFLADRLLDQNNSIEHSVRQLTQARTFKIAAEGAGPLFDAFFCLHHVSEGETDKAILDAVGLALGALAGGIAAAVGIPALGAAAVALIVGGSLSVVADTFEEDFSHLIDNLINLTANGFDAIDAPVFEYFVDATNWQPRRDPLALDLDGDGIETVRESGLGGVLFDSDADGVRTATGWVAPDDGFLVLDRNTNGTIDDGSELFGDQTSVAGGGVATDGFDALATLDENADGKIDAADSPFDELRVWQDLNQDGVSQSGELSTLAALGIESLATTGIANTVNLVGDNVSGLQGEYVRTDGTIGETHSLLFAGNPFFSSFDEIEPASDSTAGLPSLRGSGQVRDLNQAASMSGSLNSALQVYADAGTREAQLSKLDSLIAQWADTSSMLTMAERASAAGYQIAFQFGDIPALLLPETESAPGTQGTPGGVSATELAGSTNPEHTAWIERLGILERFNGLEFVSFERTLALAGAEVDPGAATGPGGSVATVLPVVISVQQLALLSKSYEVLTQSSYYGLTLQTRLQPFVDVISVSAAATGGLALDFSLVEAAFRDHVASDVYNGFIDINEFNALVNGWQSTTFIAEVYTTHAAQIEAVDNWPDDGVVFISSDSMNSTTFGNERSNLVTGDEHGNVLKGRAGNDVLLGGDGDDVLDGGTGTDVLRGGAGNDIVGSVNERGGYTVQHGKKIGNDYAGGLGDDVLHGTNFDDTYHFESGDGEDQILDYGGHNVLEMGAGIESSSVSVARIDNQHLALQIGTQGDSILTTNWYSGSGLDEVHFDDGTVWDRDQLVELDPGVLNGTEFNDTLKGKSSSEIISGFAGDDTIKGAKGDDMLLGGPGRDKLIGGYGNDVLRGGEGADSLNGGRGADVFEGGAGDDVLGTSRERGSWTLIDGRKVGNYYRGGSGNDRSTGTNHQDAYFFAPGDGEDTIREMSGNDDELSFEGGVRPDDLWVSRQGDDLVVSILDTSDRVSIDDWYRSSGRRVERFMVEAGESLDDGQLAQLVSAMAAFEPVTGLDADIPSELRDEIAPLIAASWQSTG